MGTYNEESKDIDNPEWRIIAINPAGLNIVYQEKYGSEKIETCVGLWENDTQYMLSYKDSKKIIIEKYNNFYIRFIKI